MHRFLICLILAVLPISNVSFGENENSSTYSKASTVLYRFHLDLRYLSEFRGFSKRTESMSGFRSDRGPIISPATTASLGLSRSQLDLSWFMPRGAGMEVSLRPDALTGEQDPRELDNRSGRLLEESPSVRFLDEYRIVLKRSGVEGHVGVVSKIFEDYTSSLDLLGFGLRVQGPRKAFAAGFSTGDLFSSGVDEGRSDRGVGVALDVLSGRNERHDSRTGASEEIGESPAKREPYWGGSLQARLRYGEGFTLGFGGAALQERAESGSRHIDWFQLALRRNFEGLGRWPLVLAAEMRHLKQTHQRSETRIADVRLSSFGVTSSLKFRSAETLFFAAWLGDGAIHPEGVLSSTVSARGLQTDIGWRWMVEDQLAISTAVSREWRRDGNVNGGTRGGFGDSKSGRSSQSRFAMSVSYNIGDQI